jgi:hypothetical protein
MSYLKLLLGVIPESKKARALLVGLVALVAVPLLAKVGISEEQVKATTESVLLLLASYIVGQGVADAGKEKAKLEYTDEPEEK